jgi:HSP20 family protein
MAYENHGVPSLRGEVESLFSRVLGPGRAGGAVPGPWIPTLDLVEEPGRFILEMDVPGVRLEDLAISVVGRRLTVKGSREIVRERSGPRVHLMERWSGSFSRSLDLPAQVDEGGIAATLREGILRIELPRRGDPR